MNCPTLYSHELSLVGGKNPLHRPNFILHWGSAPIKPQGESEYFLTPAHLHSEYWVLAEWQSPVEFGPPQLWDGALGPYPSRGRYFPIQSFQGCALDSAPLNLSVLRSMVYHYRRFKEHNMTTRMRNWYALEEQKEADRTRVTADILQDARPAFADTTVYRGQRSTKTAAQQRAEQIERDFNTRRP